MSTNPSSPSSHASTSAKFGRGGGDIADRDLLMFDEPEGNNGPRRSARSRNKLVVFFSFLFSTAVLLILVSGVAIYFGQQAFNAPGPLEKETTIVFNEGAGLNAFVDALERNGVVDQPFLFKMGVLAYRADRKLKPGEYVFKSAMSMRDVMNTLVEGKVILHRFTAPEGLTSMQIMQRLAKHGILTGEMPPVPVEGALLPETYTFERGTTRQSVVKQMVNEQKKALAEIWAGRDQGLPLSTPEELVVLASIVEKETGVAHERPLVASIFINRLNKGMKLQSDPTIIYGIFGGQGKPRDRSIYQSDIDKPTLYNTYTIPALPPGPIANPGRAAMEAVAHPARSEFLFFVADGSGGHVFAETLKEHEANVAKWRKIEKKRAEEAKKAAGTATGTTTQSD